MDGDASMIQNRNQQTGREKLVREVKEQVAL